MDVMLKVGDQGLTIDFIATRLIGGRKGRITKLHAHPVYHLMFITKGEGRFQVGAMHTEAKEGMLYIIDPNVPHQFFGSEDRPLANFEATFLLLDDNREPFTMSFTDLIKQGQSPAISFALIRSPIYVPAELQPLLTESFQNVIDMQKEGNHTSQKETALIALMFRVADMLRLCGGGHSGKPEKTSNVVGRLMQLFQTNVHRNVSLSEMSHFVHLQQNYLCRLFKKETGMSPQQFFLQMKLEEAMRQMYYTDMPIYLIALHLGYENVAYFSRLFRAKTGMSPSDYRKRGTQPER